MSTGTTGAAVGGQGRRRRNGDAFYRWGITPSGRFAPWFARCDEADRGFNLRAQPLTQLAHVRAQNQVTMVAATTNMLPNTET